MSACVHGCVGAGVGVGFYAGCHLPHATLLSPQSSLRLKLWMPVMGGDLLHLHMTVPIVDGGSLHAI